MASGQMTKHADACWPVHAKIIDSLEVKVVVCFGRTVGAYVRDRLDAHQEIDHFTERNQRRWTSRLHLRRGGVRVATVSHPSIADWCNPATDVSDLVARALAGSEPVVRASASVHRDRPASPPPGATEQPPKQQGEARSMSTEQINRGKGVGNLKRNPSPRSSSTASQPRTCESVTLSCPVAPTDNRSRSAASASPRRATA